MDVCAVCELFFARTFGCVAMGSALLCISAGSGVNRVQVVLYEIVLFCPGKNFM